MHVDGILVSTLILREEIGEGYFPHREGYFPHAEGNIPQLKTTSPIDPSSCHICCRGGVWQPPLIPSERTSSCPSFGTKISKIGHVCEEFVHFPVVKRGEI